MSIYRVYYSFKYFCRVLLFIEMREMIESYCETIHLIFSHFLRENYANLDGNLVKKPTNNDHPPGKLDIRKSLIN